MTYPTTPQPPRLGALISEALDAVHAHAVAAEPVRWVAAAVYVARWRERQEGA